jgi:hypothetical protein
MRKHVVKLLNHQRDILAPQAIEAVQSAVASSRRGIAEGADNEALEKQMESLETVANKWLKPYPNAAWRENVEVLLVALTVAMGIRTFFLQPFKIPTGMVCGGVIYSQGCCQRRLAAKCQASSSASYIQHSPDAVSGGNLLYDLASA